MAATRADASSGVAGKWALFLLTATYCMNIADRYLASTFLEQIKHDFGLSDGQVGLLTGSGLAVFFALTCVPLGMLADRVSRRNMIVLSLLCWSVATLLSGITRTMAGFMAGRTVVGVGEAGGTPSSFAILADFFAPRQRPMAMSIFATGASIGGLVGTTGGAMIAERFGWRAAFVVFGLIGVPLALMLFLTVREPRRGRFDAPSAAATVQTGFGPALRLAYANRPLFHVLMGITAMSLWGWGLLWWLPAYLMRSRGFSLEVSGQYLGYAHGFGGTAVLLCVAFGLGGGRFGRVQVLGLLKAAIALLTVLALTIFWVADTGYTVAATVTFTALLYCYTGPSTALVQDLTPPSHRGKIFAMLTISAAITNLLMAPVLIGALSDLFAMLGRSPGAALGSSLGLWALLGIWTYFHFARAASLLRHLDGPQ